MQGRGTVMGDHNWDLSEAGWRELNVALRDGQAARVMDWDQVSPSPSLVRELAVDEAADALWDRGQLF